MSLLFPHQEAGAKWLAARPRAYLADVPGLGKTRTLIAALQLVGAKRPLVVCPAIVRSHWWNEFGAMGWDVTNDPPMTIMSYEQIVRGGEEMREAFLSGAEGWPNMGVPPVDSLILDEAHLARTAGAQRTRLLLGKYGYARRLPIVWAASGTPQWKHPGNLWTVLSTLFPDVVTAHGLKTYRDWMDRFCVYSITEYGPRVHAARNTTELRAILDKVMLRRTLDDVGLSLPATFWQPWVIDGEQSDELKNADADIATNVEGALVLGESDPHVATFRRLVGEAKAPVIAAALVEELEGGDEQIVVMAYHRNVLDVLRTALRPFGVSYVDGSTGANARALVIDRFQKGATRVFLGQIDACQAGITLTAARRVVIVEPSWTANVNVQAAARVARIGQGAEHCIVQVVALANTLDEAITRRNVQEARMAQEVFSAGTETDAGKAPGTDLPAVRGG